MYKLDKETTLKLIELTEQKKVNRKVWNTMSLWINKLEAPTTSLIVSLLLDDKDHKEIIDYLTHNQTKKEIYYNQLINDYIYCLINSAKDSNNIKDNLFEITKKTNYDTNRLKKMLELSLVPQFETDKEWQTNCYKNIINNDEYPLYLVESIFKNYHYSVMFGRTNAFEQLKTTLSYNDKYKSECYMNIMEQFNKGPETKKPRNFDKKFPMFDMHINNTIKRYDNPRDLKTLEETCINLIKIDKIDILPKLIMQGESLHLKQELVDPLSTAVFLLKKHKELSNRENKYLYDDLINNLGNKSSIAIRILYGEFDLEKDREFLQSLYILKPEARLAIKPLIHKQTQAIFEDKDFLTKLNKVEDKDEIFELTRNRGLELGVIRKNKKKEEPTIINPDTITYVSRHYSKGYLQELKSVLTGNTTENETIKNPYKKEM